MKKVILTLAIVLGLGMASFAENGGLFGRGEAESAGFIREGGNPALPGEHDLPGNQPAPVGSGIAMLIGFGAAYAFAKKREE